MSILYFTPHQSASQTASPRGEAFIASIKILRAKALRITVELKLFPFVILSEAKNLIDFASIKILRAKALRMTL
jgi:hypothetical protein